VCMSAASYEARPLSALTNWRLRNAPHELQRRGPMHPQQVGNHDWTFCDPIGDSFLVRRARNAVPLIEAFIVRKLAMILPYV
jgi:hypothetical protein